MKQLKVELILNHLIEHKIINQVIAGEQYNCWRLSSIIHDLRKSGINIETIKSKKEPCSYYLKSRKPGIELSLYYEKQRNAYYRRRRNNTL